MPIYEFQCGACGKAFERLVFTSDKENPECPECHSHETKRQLSVFSRTGGTEKSLGSSCGTSPSSGFS